MIQTTNGIKLEANWENYRGEKSAELGGEEIRLIMLTPSWKCFCSPCQLWLLLHQPLMALARVSLLQMDLYVYTFVSSWLDIKVPDIKPTVSILYCFLQCLMHACYLSCKITELGTRKWHHLTLPLADKETENEGILTVCLVLPG